MIRLIFLIYICLSFAPIARADDRLVRLMAPQALLDSGLLKHLLPRFSLKTQVRVQIVALGEAHEVAFGSEGTPVFVGPSAVWSLRVLEPEHKAVRRFTDWLSSEVGQRTITSYTPGGIQMFTLAEEQEAEELALEFDGNVALGRDLSRRLCGRCHVVRSEERMNSIGSTPSFFVLRTLDNWADRFQAFYTLNPHPSFTQVKGVTLPFAENLPPPIVPVEITLGQLDAILAYVAKLTPADLGAPLQHQ